jgi:hypothetical protein
MDGGAGFVIAFGNFEGTYYRYTKRHRQRRIARRHRASRSGANGIPWRQS